MASADEALKLLRTNPSDAVSTYTYLSEAATTGSIEGGQCQVTCRVHPLNKDAFLLNYKPGRGDWFFPYMTIGLAKGAGYCVVPLGQYEGSIALTGAMNGCALQVNRHQNTHYFYHDANGKQIARLAKAPPGEIVCRVTYEMMSGPKEVITLPSGGQIEEAREVNVGRIYEKHGFTGAYFRIDIFTVRHAGKWLVVRSGSFEAAKSGTTDRVLDRYNPTRHAILAEFDAGI